MYVLALAIHQCCTPLYSPVKIWITSWSRLFIGSSGLGSAPAFRNWLRQPKYNERGKKNPTFSLTLMSSACMYIKVSHRSLVPGGGWAPITIAGEGYRRRPLDMMEPIHRGFLASSAGGDGRFADVKSMTDEDDGSLGFPLK
jgi:hypothetical protein